VAAEPEAVRPEAEGWNYFNYFTEVEEHFQRSRGTGLFLMSPLDWALVESWKNAGVPLEAVLRGIEVAFDKSRRRRRRHENVNSVAYCAQAIQREAEQMAKGGAVRQPSAPFELDELRQFLRENAELLRAREDFREVADKLAQLADEAEEHYTDLETLEQRLTALEEKLSAIVRSSLAEDELFALRAELEGAMRPYRGRMTAEQIVMLERQYLDRRIQEKAGLPRLSLFYLK
jgi:polyhydroxyalkanoate synthesis regulator phasin